MRQLESASLVVGALAGAGALFSPALVQLAMPYAAISLAASGAFVGIAGLLWRWIRVRVRFDQVTWSAVDLRRAIHVGNRQVALVAWIALILTLSAMFIFGFWSALVLARIIL